MALSCCACDHFDKNEENFQPNHAKEPSSKTASHEISLPEKSRLQDFVKDFAKCAVRGVQCEVIDAGSGAVLPAAYYVDPLLQRLKLTKLRRSEAGGNDEAPLQELELADIQEIQDLEAARPQRELWARAAPEAVRRATEGDGMADRLVVIASGQRAQTVFLLEGSAVDRDRFIMCTKILRLYAQTHGSAGSS
eukprot:CAMPEP_0204551508 /NCGR_PEP_ID=MMETSP0661-20131031/25932_1 /ASSEMBLY_ACC=CAM_ASM_000606 /TAXON_ID=109239 /ORGANISM="Alexandrium margalefi, Strain AMGDE01CS-322" /LENGTH=192 /DNA_ID=CAMNT_0051558503 /DNA_START=39 /DNA_END=617 /DNA_ORIENTATION=-